MTDNLNSILSPEHLVDLRKSGLSDETILESGIKSVRPGDIDKIIGFPTFAKSAYAIPYPGTDYSRYRMFYDDANKINPKTGDERPKYLAKKDSGNHLYIPPKVRPFLNDLTVPLCVIEGEKKSLKACQAGLKCISIPGLWNWSDGSKNLISDFDQIALNGREVFIVPDSHFRKPDRHGKPKNLFMAVRELAYRLIDKGAKVSWVELQTSDIEVKLDDYLINHTAKEFQELPKHEIFGLKESLDRATPEIMQEELHEILRQIAKIKSETERDRCVNILRDKTGISKRAILTEIKHFSAFSDYPQDDGEGGDGEAGQVFLDDEEKKLTAYFPGLVDLVTDDKGKVAFLVKNGTSLKIMNSWENDGRYFPPSKTHLPFVLARASHVLPHFEYDNDQRLFLDVLAYLKRFSYLPDNQWLIVACNIFLGYLQDHSDIHYLPMLLFFAVPERGKSRTGKAITYISFRGVHVVDMRESNLFRYSENLKATIFFDLMNLWQKAEKNGSEDVLLLRYEKGAKVSRVIYPEKGAFKDTVFYSVYGSTIIATNEAVHKILGSRCINIDMENRPAHYENPTPEKAQELKERLTAWRSRIMDKPLPEINTVGGLGGRLWDISKPLLQVCRLIHPQGFDELVGALLEVAGRRVEDKKESIEGRIVLAIYELSPKDLFEWNIKTSELLKVLNEDRPDTHKLTAQYVGRKIRSMGLQTRHMHGLSEVSLNRSDFNIILNQYGIQEITLPNSTYSTCPTKLRDSRGRELVESGEHSTLIRPVESLENSGRVELVELGRESSGSLGENNNEDIPEVEFVEEAKN